MCTHTCTQSGSGRSKGLGGWDDEAREVGLGHCGKKFPSQSLEFDDQIE